MLTDDLGAALTKSLVAEGAASDLPELVAEVRAALAALDGADRE